VLAKRTGSCNLSTMVADYQQLTNKGTGAFPAAIKDWRSYNHNWAAMRSSIHIFFFVATFAMTSATSFAVEQPEPLFFSQETNAIASARIVLAAVRDARAHSRTNIQSLIGHKVVFIGGAAPRGTNADLTLGDSITLKVEIRPFRDVRPMSVLWESEVLGTLDGVEFTNRVIHITARPEYWKVRQTW
jgi:hypothetical protein